MIVSGQLIKMRPTIINLKKVYEVPQKVPFKPVTEMGLTNKINSKDTSEKAKNCVQEFTILAGCLQTHSYDNHLCKEQSDNFNKCYEVYLKQKWQKRQANKAALPPYSKSYTIPQINKYLENFCQK